MLHLDAEGAEGLVFKPPAEGLRVKYVTPEINVDDIVVDGPLLTELPAEFFVGRLVRLAISLEELGLADRIERVERRVGRALVSGFLETVRAVLRDGKATRTYRVRLRSERAADALVAHLDRASLKIQAREVERRREGEWIHLVVEKTFLRSTSVLRNLLAGHHVLD
ncbi:MAG: hypothetical protein KatS3mg076_0903 [Candidatus Binatia bacterium]|nr:MAG: hypothetical protein KatS3mg076_0903 [Candidatus Binatia bacterium]